MHPLIEGIIGASASRRKLAVAGSAKDQSATQKHRDLMNSSEKRRGEGITPVIAEIKPRILSRPLHEGEAKTYARSYLENGACAISVLTEPSYFLGSLDTLPLVREAVDIPVLRKDFIVEEVQLDEAYADLVLLIAGICPNVRDMVESARSRGMEPLVEVHRDEELEIALDSGARIVGINNRDLETFEVSIENTFRLIPKIPKEVIKISESGISNNKDVLRIRKDGVNAVLIGGAFLGAENIEEKMREIMTLAMPT